MLQDTEEDIASDEHLSFEDTDENEDEKYISFEVGVLDLLDFGGPNMMRNGDQVYKASHLLELGVISVGEKTCKLEGICLQTSHPASTPHTLTIDTADDFKKWNFHCTCKAGNGGRCKHVYAALLHINIVKKWDVLTCTQRKKNWGKVSKQIAESVLEPELICNLAEMKCKRIEYHVTEEEDEYFQSVLFSDPKSAVAIFLDRHNKAESSKTDAKLSASANSCNADLDVTDDIRKFLTNLFKTDFNLRRYIFKDMVQTVVNFYNKRVCVTLEEAVDLNIKTLDQKNTLWLSERKFRITASECYKLFTASKNPNVLWTIKIANYFKAKPKLKNFEIGCREEDNGIRLYEKEAKQKVTKIGLVVHPSCPWLGCSPDGFVMKTNTVIEVKTLLNDKNEPFNVALKSVKYLVLKNGCYNLRERHLYYGQVQLNIHLLCAPKADLVIHNYQSKEIQIIRVNYNKKFCAELINSLQSIYFNYALPYTYENFTTETDKCKYRK